MMNRALARAVRQFADSTSDRIADQPTVHFWANVSAVSRGAARDGNAAVWVSWRGAQYRVNAYADSYTPAVGHRVKCDYIDGQISIAYHGIGQP